MHLAMALSSYFTSLHGGTWKLGASLPGGQKMKKPEPASEVADDIIPLRMRTDQERRPGPGFSFLTLKEKDFQT